jgi:hypothetical protein
MEMTHLIGLYHNAARYGQVELDSLFVMGPADYSCEPEGVVTDVEVGQIAKVLRREPETHCGVIGQYEWREESHCH